jgi:hypothetical protein
MPDTQHPSVALPPFIAEHADRPARVVYEEGWPWAGRPWPWCPMAEHTRPPKNNPGAPIEEWEVFIPARPHDNHLVNGGNTHCPGIAGTIPATPVEVHQANLRRALNRADRADKRLADAQQELRAAHVEIDRQEALVAYAQSSQSAPTQEVTDA